MYFLYPNSPLSQCNKSPLLECFVFDSDLLILISYVISHVPGKELYTADACPQGKHRTKTQLQVTEAGVGPGVEIGGLPKCVHKRAKFFFSATLTFKSITIFKL